jgi:hypothetical protein
LTEGGVQFDVIEKFFNKGCNLKNSVGIAPDLPCEVIATDYNFRYLFAREGIRMMTDSEHMGKALCATVTGSNIAK